MSLAEDTRDSSRPRYNNNPPSQALNTATTSTSSKPINPVPVPMSKPNTNQNTTEDPFKQVQGDELEDGEDDDDDEDGGATTKRPANAKRAGRRKIKIEYIQEKSRRHITFSKRKSGIMKKAFELSTLTGTQVLLLVVSETGLVYTFTTPKLQPIVTKEAGRNLIQACLHSAEPAAIGEGEEGGSPDDAAAGEHSNEDDDDNDEPQQQEGQDQQDQGSELEQEEDAQGEDGEGVGDDDEGQTNHQPTLPATYRQSSSGPPGPPGPGAGQPYPPRGFPPPPTQHAGPLMYPPPYNHIPYPAPNSAGGQQPGGASAGQEGAARPYWGHPLYSEYGYPPYYPPPSHPPHFQRPHPQQHHPQQYVQQQQQYAKKAGGGGVSSGQDPGAVQKEE
ncbi:transcription factor of the MADS box [Mortierella sp. 14UC]|nr:transcription factor of the MADS box [Mortierella sp. 14UC]